MTSPFARNIKALRDSLGMKQGPFADSLDITRATLINWESGRVKRPRQQDIIDTIKDRYSLTDTDLFGYSDGLYANIYHINDMKGAEASESYAPIVGNIAAGEPSEAIEYSGDKLWIPPELLERDPDTFYLYVTSDSLDQTEFRQGVYAAISPNSEVHNGDIAAVKVNGDDATLKVYNNHDGVIVLEPRSHNPEYKRIIIDSADPDAIYFRVIGKAVWPYYPVNF